MVDLTGGMGIDFIALSKNFRFSTYVEQEKELVEIAKHNVEIADIHKHVHIEHQSAEEYIQQLDSVDVAFIDPHRRDALNHKIVLLEDCLPNVIALQTAIIKKSKTLLIKASPMLSIKQAMQSLNFIKEIHVVSVKNECKEVLFLIERDWKSEPKVIASDIRFQHTTTFSFTFSEEEDLFIQTSGVQKYLYLPNSSITKAGAFKSIAKRFSLAKLHKNTHIYTSNTLIKDFPGRVFELQEELLYAKAKGRLKALAIDRATIILRNFKEDISSLKKKLKIKGESNDIIFATTNCDDKQVILLTKEYLCD